jgi:hypothetical protein
MKVKHYIKALLVFMLLTMAGSCNEYLGLTVNCDDCWGYRPDSADLIINLTINNSHPEVPIVVYRGHIEGGQVDWVDTARQTPYYLYSAIDQYYSVTAEYKVDGKTIMAVDGDEMKTKDASSSCEFECWIVVDGELKVDLK